MLEKTRRTLLKQIEARHDESLARLYDSEAPLVAALLRARGVSSQDIEDILQETFLAVWNQAASFRGEGSVAAWVWVIARNQWISRTRSPAHRQIVTEYAESAQGFDDPSMRMRPRRISDGDVLPDARGIGCRRGPGSISSRGGGRTHGWCVYVSNGSSSGHGYVTPCEWFVPDLLNVDLAFSPGESENLLGVTGEEVDRVVATLRGRLDDRGNTQNESNHSIRGFGFGYEFDDAGVPQTLDLYDSAGELILHFEFKDAICSREHRSEFICGGD